MSIIKLSFKDRTLLFAKLSSIAYNNTKKATSQAKKLGFTTVEFYDRDGAQAYRFMNKDLKTPRMQALILNVFLIFQCWMFFKKTIKIIIFNL